MSFSEFFFLLSGLTIQGNLISQFIQVSLIIQGRIDGQNRGP
jgi:hypothetical protein